MVANAIMGFSVVVFLMTTLDILLSDKQKEAPSTTRCLSLALD